MRLLSILTLTTLLSAPAFAADLGTYRPGSPYHSVVAPGADVCESVKVNPRAPGVCEFNSKSVNPIESAISISGAGGASLAPNLLQGDTNTIRVGTRPAPKPRTNTVTVGKTPSGRRIVRKAVPQRIQPSKTVARRPAQTGSLTEQQNKYRAATGHVAPQTKRPPQGYPQSRKQAARPQMRQQQGQRLMRDPRIQAPRPQAPRFQHNLDGAPRGHMMARPVPPQGRPAPQQQSRAPQARDAQGRPQIGVPIGPQGQPQAARRTAPLPQQRAIPKGSVNDPVTHQNGQQRVQAAAQRQAQPRPMAAPPVDPNAPIPTSQARPTQPVEQGILGALAGG